MPKIKVNTTSLGATESDLQSVLDRVRSIASEFNSVSSNLDWDVKAESSINSRLSRIGRELDAELRGIGSMKTFLGEARRAYTDVENKNNHAGEESETDSSTSLWDSFINFITGKISSEDRHSIIQVGYLGVLNSSVTTSFKPSDYLNFSDDDFFSDTLNLFNEAILGEALFPKQKKKPIKQINPETDWYDEKATLLEIKAENKREVSFMEAKVAGNAKYAQGSVEAKIGTAEAHAEASAGLYVYETNPDGTIKKTLSPSVSAEVGASCSAVSVDAEGRIGLGEDNNMLGVYGKVEAEALSAEAKGKVKLNSKEIYAGASAEANLLKAEASGGVSILGTDIGVSGSVKVGIGAHAEVGFVDGKFKLDIGAAFGVGVDVGFELDVSGTVDAVCGAVSGAADAVWEGVQKAWNWVKWW